MVATLIEAFGNNFNDDDKCDKCDSRKYLVKSCYMKGLNDNPTLCNKSLAQYDGISQNCQHNGTYCTPGSCAMGDKDSIDASCKSTKNGGKLSKPICTGINLGKGCNDNQETLIPRYLQECQPEQNYGYDGNNFYFCKYQTGTGPWTITNSQCQLKQ